MEEHERIELAREFVAAWRDYSEMTMEKFLNLKGIHGEKPRQETANAIAEELAQKAILLEMLQANAQKHAVELLEAIGISDKEITGLL